MIYIFTPQTPLTEYLFTDIDGLTPIFYPQRINYSVVDRGGIFFYNHFCNKIYTNPLPGDVTRKLRSIKTTDKLIVIEEYSYLLNLVSRLCKHVNNKSLYLWNPIAKTNISVGRYNYQKLDPCERYLEFCKSLGFRISTFDIQDSIDYKIGYYPQFYRLKNSVVGNDLTSDFFFCGTEKGRKAKIDMFQRVLSKFGLCDFIIVGKGFNDPLPYNQYLEHIYSTKVLCDITQDNQSGLTQRAIEAMFLEKKLITNNENIKQYDFYNERNILIMNEDTSEQSVFAFLNLDMKNVSSNILSKYHVETWANSI
ncbi:hypothetical protein L6475_10265 [Prevotella sp. E9-3]|uniref:hypothetical protein n=1 Tax=Prevotella sp. E9-3 TaxID=2913621 RepID=UPI001EDB867F|nr:hypothetical protein [Prevotella sp. E9-3]UKK47602.1 hypothetical protein L6475_10265 [Prevotella sp. E9-3]